MSRHRLPMIPHDRRHLMYEQFTHSTAYFLCLAATLDTIAADEREGLVLDIYKITHRLADALGCGSTRTPEESLQNYLETFEFPVDADVLDSSELTEKEEA